MKAQTMRRVRQFHHYLGLFFAPAIILFAVSGAFQTFRWQEAKGYGGTPPQWIVWIASVHMDQALPRPAKAGKKDGEIRKDANKSGNLRAQQPLATKRPNPFPLKLFTGLMSIGLLLSSLLGIAIALNSAAMRRVSIVMLFAGSILPLLLLLA